MRPPRRPRHYTGETSSSDLTDVSDDEPSADESNQAAKNITAISKEDKAINLFTSKRSRLSHPKRTAVNVDPSSKSIPIPIESKPNTLVAPKAQKPSVAQAGSDDTKKPPQRSNRRVQLVSLSTSTSTQQPVPNATKAIATELPHADAVLTKSLTQTPPSSEISDDSSAISSCPSHDSKEDVSPVSPKLPKRLYNVRYNLELPPLPGDPACFYEEDKINIEPRLVILSF